MTLINYLDYVIIPILSVSMIITFIRLIRGPRVVDRVIALDLIITIGIGFITVFSIRSGKELFMDVAMILALIAFLGTVAFSYYLEKKT
ncbi:monovalent cation/H+ antiporter complex subunit F [Leadbetterella byssophila]|uniref:Multisubunit sodium/proton antiporter, MrpF subunit n=1 Tax=Leadbetterella byssophila (strain DSM 17132 / JCM 16389 / KACC 11308 / NBRC 106382 / 4M15) TaxID=649349 RepID=E4RTA3_LEAB4|nr:monovalent cation/H+ antiporter complex subunit F [Leadbetterella byssophila]ADQ18641.1 multisubunit sodium/proton antiporter, MrpF subunit [Leadbetterella byssophila DSM 17132]